MVNLTHSQQEIRKTPKFLLNRRKFIAEQMPHRMHRTDAAHCYMSDVAWSVCMLSTRVSRAKTDEPTVSRSGTDSCGSQEPSIRLDHHT